MSESAEVVKEPVKEWLSPVEAAEYTGLSKPRIYAMIKEGTLIQVKEIPESEREHRGPQVLINRDSLDTYLANRDKPREKHTGTSTKYVPRGPHLTISDDDIRVIQNVSLKDLIAAYKERRIDRTVYTPRDAARATGLQQAFVQKLCDMKMIDCVCEEGRTYITERGIKDIKDRLET